MQTLTSIRRRGWFGRIASLPLSFFYFFAKATSRTVRVRCGPIRAQTASFRARKFLLGGLNDVPLNFGGQNPPNTELLGA